MAAIFVLLAGCGSTPREGQFQDSFATHIYDNGTKLFRYEFSRGDRTRPLIPFDQSGGFTDGKQVYSAAELRKKNARHLHHQVEEKLEQSGYCREGFFTLDTLISYASASLRGECKDGASAEDRARFPNTGQVPAS